MFLYLRTSMYLSIYYYVCLNFAFYRQGLALGLAWVKHLGVLPKFELQETALSVRYYIPGIVLQHMSFYFTG